MHLQAGSFFVQILKFLDSFISLSTSRRLEFQPDIFVKICPLAANSKIFSRFKTAQGFFNIFFCINGNNFFTLIINMFVKIFSIVNLYVGRIKQNKFCNFRNSFCAIDFSIKPIFNQNRQSPAVV